MTSYTDCVAEFLEEHPGKYFTVLEINAEMHPDDNKILSTWVACKTLVYERRAKRRIIKSIYHYAYNERIVSG